MKGKRNTARRLVCILLAIVLLGSLVSGALIIMVNAASSKEIEQDLIALREEQAKLKEQSDALQSQINENQQQTQTLVSRKADIDQQMEVSRQTIENLNAQIQQYSLLIAQKQDELDASVAEEQALQQQYKTRLRAMEETGSVSYWSILFKASSFSDLLDRVDMIREIAKSDQLMLEKLAAASEKIESERAGLETQLAGLETAKQELAEQQSALEAQRAESDMLILQMTAEFAALSDEYDAAEAAKDELLEQIKKTETEYFNALSAEEAARLAALNAQNNNKVPASGSGASSESGFLYPLPYAVEITSPFGMRHNPVTGKYSSHSGVDFGAGQGTSIYACKSGTVTVAGYAEAWGYYVTINHGDGYSTLYAHMTNYTVSTGDYVAQGDVIGYVGSTGWSTGPHLHLSVLYNGAYVNPMNYVSAP
ncbi:MAG: peptidoglycan DD-metalloendopeptidase family protein [Clostridiales bacterium]|nr:peptidoglycan DD-metalloendopeptidase family protein [Clostridiales bacterium]